MLRFSVPSPPLMTVRAADASAREPSARELLYIYIYIYIYILLLLLLLLYYIYIYIYVHLFIHIGPGCSRRKGTNGVSTNGVAAIFIVLFRQWDSFGCSRQPTFIFPKVPGRTFFPNLSKSLFLQLPHIIILIIITTSDTIHTTATTNNTTNNTNAAAAAAAAAATTTTTTYQYYYYYYYYYCCCCCCYCY